MKNLTRVTKEGTWKRSRVETFADKTVIICYIFKCELVERA